MAIEKERHNDRTSFGKLPFGQARGSEERMPSKIICTTPTVEETNALPKRQTVLKAETLMRVVDSDGKVRKGRGKTMNIVEARKVFWLKRNYRPMRELLGESYLTRG